mmetsp:Transcript_3006/g.8499  ORF Transcript_3006/g.8499 Transcript_3006/m.8499 type:complete len:327 (-) Transcript_3006:520-1500(-)
MASPPPTVRWRSARLCTTRSSSATWPTCASAAFTRCSSGPAHQHRGMTTSCTPTQRRRRTLCCPSSGSGTSKCSGRHMRWTSSLGCPTCMTPTLRVARITSWTSAPLWRCPTLRATTGRAWRSLCSRRLGRRRRPLPWGRRAARRRAAAGTRPPRTSCRGARPPQTSSSCPSSGRPSPGAPATRRTSWWSTCSTSAPAAGTASRGGRGTSRSQRRRAGRRASLRASSWRATPTPWAASSYASHATKTSAQGRRRRAVQATPATAPSPAASARMTCGQPTSLPCRRALRSGTPTWTARSSTPGSSSCRFARATTTSLTRPGAPGTPR